MNANFTLTFFWFSEKLELIEAGKAGPVGGDPPSPRCSTPHTPHPEVQVNDLQDSGVQMDHHINDIGLQVGPEFIYITFL